MVWLDLLPPNTDLRTVCEDLLVDQVAGLYDTDTKTMCIPSPPPSVTNRPRANIRPKKPEDLSGLDTAIVFAHEYTHALEDQYWPIDNPKDKESRGLHRRRHRPQLPGGRLRHPPDDRGDPRRIGERKPGRLCLVWNLLHSGFGEFAMDYARPGLEKSRR